MKRDTSVRAYSSVGCSATLGYNSDLATILNACIAGYGQVEVQSIVVATGGVATITTTTDHQFFQWEVVKVVGSADSAWNTDWKIESIVSSTVFTVLTDFSAGTVSGTMTAQVSPLIHLTTTSFTLDGSGLSITNSTNTTSIAWGYMPSYPAVLQKSLISSETSVPWYLICDSKTIIFLNVIPSGTTQYGFTFSMPLMSTAGTEASRIAARSPTTASYWDEYSGGFRSSDNAALTIAKPATALINPAPTYIGQSELLMANTGINPIDGKRVYFPVYLYTNSGYKYFSPWRGLYIPVGLKPANGIYEEMLHFTGSSGYGFCVDLRGPWYG